MLEEKKYSQPEMAKLLNTPKNENIKRKLERYGVEYVCEGRGASATFSIQPLSDFLKFKLFCILDLSFPAQMDFSKLSHFLYYLFNDEDFIKCPMEKMEAILTEKGTTISRQTIANWIKKFSNLNLFDTCGDPTYFRVIWEDGKKRHEEVSREEYAKAWKIYWDCKNKEYDTAAAASAMMSEFNGFPRKQRKIEFNGIEKDTIEKLSELSLNAFIEEQKDHINSD